MPPTRPFYVTDTHPFVWYLAGDEERLSLGAKSVFENADSAKAVVVIPAIVLAELSRNSFGIVRFSPRPSEPGLCSDYRVSPVISARQEMVSRK